MHRQIPREPLRPCAFPFGQERKRPLDRSENGEHSQKNLLAVNRCPPTDTEHHQGDKYDDFVYSHDDTRCQRREPQLRCILLHVRNLVHASLFHRCLDKVGIGRTRVGDIGLCLQGSVHRVAHVNQLLHFLELVRDLRGFGLVQVMCVRTDAVRDIGEEI